MEYDIVRADSIPELVEDVNTKCRLAWEPTGGILKTPTGYAQAILKRLPDSKLYKLVADRTETQREFIAFCEQHKNDEMPVVWQAHGFYHIAGKGNFCINCKDAEQAHMLLENSLPPWD